MILRFLQLFSLKLLNRVSVLRREHFINFTQNFATVGKWNSLCSYENIFHFGQYAFIQKRWQTVLYLMTCTFLTDKQYFVAYFEIIFVLRTSTVWFGSLKFFANYFWVEFLWKHFNNLFVYFSTFQTLKCSLCKQLNQLNLLHYLVTYFERVLFFSQDGFLFDMVSSTLLTWYLC